MLCAAIDRRPKPKAAQKMPSISTNSTTAYYDRQYNARASVQDPLAYMTRYTQESQAALHCLARFATSATAPGLRMFWISICPQLGQRKHKLRLFSSSSMGATGRP